MASGTHPLAVWSRVRPTAQPRYGKVMHDLQMVGSRTVVCGMHVHVEVPDLSARVDLMNRIQRYLPLLLALSTSSPFWQSQRTGLLGYRLAAYRELPRTGFPELFPGRRRLPALHRHPDGGAGDREFELCLVDHPAIAETPDARIARRRQLHAPRRYAGDRGALSLPRAPPRPRSRAQCRPDRRLPGDQRGERLARPALRHPRQLRRRGDAQRHAGPPDAR